MTLVRQPDHTLSRGLATQCRVVGALIMRELHTRFGRDNVGYLWFIFEPCLLGIGITGIHFMTGIHLPNGMAIMPFYVTGYSAYMMFRSNVNRATSTIEPNRGLLYHSRISLADLVLSRCLLEAAATTVALFLLLLVGHALGLGRLPDRPALILAGMALMFWLTLGLAMIICAASAYSTLLERLIHPTTYFLLPISGTFFMLDWLPEKVRAFVSLITIPQIIELVRMGEFGEFQSKYVNLPYIVGWNALLTLFGLVALRVARRKIEL